MPILNLHFTFLFLLSLTFIFSTLCSRARVLLVGIVTRYGFVGPRRSITLGAGFSLAVSLVVDVYQRAVEYYGNKSWTFNKQYERIHPGLVMFVLYTNSIILTPSHACERCYYYFVYDLS